MATLKFSCCECALNPSKPTEQISPIPLRRWRCQSAEKPKSVQLQTVPLFAGLGCGPPRQPQKILQAPRMTETPTMEIQNRSSEKRSPPTLRFQFFLAIHGLSFPGLLSSGTRKKLRREFSALLKLRGKFWGALCASHCLHKVPLPLHGLAEGCVGTTWRIRSIAPFANE